jgi:hypothetical protein
MGESVILFFYTKVPLYFEITPYAHSRIVAEDRPHSHRASQRFEAGVTGAGPADGGYGGGGAVGSSMRIFHRTSLSS